MGHDIPDLSEEGPRILHTLRDIKSGVLSAKALLPEDRMAVVAHLMAEGYSVVEMAEILKVHERTVQRDKKLIRSQNALHASPTLPAEIAGQLMQEAETAAAQIRRALRDKDASVSDRVQGYRAVWLTYTECVDTLQRLGYLPTAPTEVHARHSLSVESPAQDALHLKAELARIEEIARSSGSGPDLDEQVFAQISLIRAQIETVQLQELVQPPESKETPS